MNAVVADAVLAVVALAAALWLRPWRALGNAGPPWAWIVAWATLPMLWGLDRYAHVAVLQPMSGAALLVLLAGWPLAVIALLPAALATAVAGDLGWVEGVHRLVWLGLVPATLTLAIGAAMRRWLPKHLFVYILGRGFFATLAALALAAAALFALGPPRAQGDGDVLLARLVLGFGEAFITGMLIASLVAFRPHLLATYADRLYLPR